MSKESSYICPHGLDQPDKRFCPACEHVVLNDCDVQEKIEERLATGRPHRERRRSEFFITHRQIRLLEFLARLSSNSEGPYL